MDLTVVVLVAVLVIAYGAVSGRLRSTVLTAPILFTAAGVLIGPSVLDLVGLDLGAEGLRLLAEITLALVLFTDAVRIDPTRLRRQAGLPARLLLLGFPATVALGAAAGWWLLPGVGWATAALIAATLAPTDAALGQAVVSDERVPARIRQTLNVESGLNDGLAVPFVTVFIAIAAATLGAESEAARDGLGWVTFVAQQVGFGLAAGVLIGGLGAKLVDRASLSGWMDGTFRQITPLALALLAWAGAENVGGNGFIAAFVAGLAFGAVAPPRCHDVTDFSEDEGQLLGLIVFLVFGAAMLGPVLQAGVPLSVVLYGVASLTIVRMLPVALSLIGAGLLPATPWFIGWFGPRGLASIVFALLVVDEFGGLVGAQVEQSVSVVVAMSIVAHGITARPLASRYAQWVQDRLGDDGASDLAEHQVVADRRLGRAAR